ncbi:hypothetical protein FOZ60_013807 [Perkinsus olseni]|uniref:C3H1-type domain-containing protein n=1 Tax=Perkinsus olseni TaxID=32597 RepID=A0A7J6P7X8_PEROL|nr:hypothetical protein FOZ60_013807 [Perkinsus olseni]
MVFRVPYGNYVKHAFASTFLKGRCHYGTNCTFAHYDSELFKKPNLARTKLCAKPNCSDPDCTYAHSVEELRQPGEASDMDTARVEIEHEKVLGEQRALLTVHNMMAQTGNDGVEYASPGILPSPSLLPTPPARFSPTIAGTTTGGGATSGGIAARAARPDRSHSRGSVHRSTLNALAAKNEELRRQVEMSNTVLAHLLQIASAQAVPETPYVAVTPPTNVFSQQQQQPQQPVTTPSYVGHRGRQGSRS